MLKMVMTTTNVALVAEDAEDAPQANRRVPSRKSQKTTNSRSRTLIAATRKRKATSKKNDLVVDHAVVVEAADVVEAETANRETARIETIVIAIPPWPMRTTTAVKNHADEELSSRGPTQLDTSSNETSTTVQTPMDAVEVDEVVAVEVVVDVVEMAAEEAETAANPKTGCGATEYESVAYPCSSRK